MQLAATTNEIWAVISEVLPLEDAQPSEEESEVEVSSKASKTRIGGRPGARPGKQKDTNPPSKGGSKVKAKPAGKGKKAAEPVYRSGMTPSCARVVQIAEDIVDRWPHAVPPIPVATIINNRPPDTVRSPPSAFLFIDPSYVVHVHRVTHASLN